MTTEQPKRESEEIESLARQIHGVYCRYRLEIHGEPYWTGGNYDLLDEKTKDADRYMARFVVAALSTQAAELDQLRKVNARCAEIAERDWKDYAELKAELDRVKGELDNKTFGRYVATYNAQEKVIANLKAELDRVKSELAAVRAASVKLQLSYITADDEISEVRAELVALRKNVRLMCERWINDERVEFPGTAFEWQAELDALLK